MNLDTPVEQYLPEFAGTLISERDEPRIVLRSPPGRSRSAMSSRIPAACRSCRGWSG